VDDPTGLGAIMRALEGLARRLPILFPVHPRTMSRLEQGGLIAQNGTPSAIIPRLLVTPPMSYMEFIGAMERAAFVVTDSGGIQEETTALGVPCLTLRENTERPVTVTEGTNILVGRDLALLEKEVEAILAGRSKQGRRPHLWDGAAAERIVSHLASINLGRFRTLMLAGERA
jgi:UDP-N-acetylglucosamine 2-epimerase (non-hydrolysing)